MESSTTPNTLEKDIVSENKIRKYIYGWLVWLRAILGMHVFYVYASAAGDGSKWGTFVEATTDQISFLPYSTTEDTNKLYQNFLFDGCAKPVFSWTNIGYVNVLCDIYTDDYKVFTLSVPPNTIWSDGEPLTVEDVFFTYSTLLKENVRNLPQFTNYKNINIQIDGTQLIFSFLDASIDNMIFFTNFVLPEHILANQEYDFYTTVFAQNPVSSWCAKLQAWQNDVNSAIFDLSLCDETSIKFYQVKYFSGYQELNTYIGTDAADIDIALTQNSLDWFWIQQYITNKFSMVFINTQKNSSTKLRSSLIGIINKAIQWHPLLIEDNFLFDNIAQDINIEEIPRLIENQNNPPVETDGADWEDDNGLPSSILLWDDYLEPKIYSIDKPITQRKVMNISFDVWYDEVSVTQNNGGEYFPKSYSSLNQSASYNISPILWNIIQWKNTYSIKWYTDNELVDSFDIIIEYLIPNEEVEEIIEEEIALDAWEFETLDMIYFEDTINTSIVKNLDAYLKNNNLWWIINFEWYTDVDEMEWKIVSGEYDMVLRTINMWLRKDLSNIFTSDVAFINPTKYLDEDLASLLSEYFTASYDRQQIIKTSIDRIYAESYPLVILWKQLDAYQLNDSIKQSPFPERMYVFGWRKDYIPDIQWFGHVTIDWERLLQRSNFVDFIKDL